MTFVVYFIQQLKADFMVTARIDLGILFGGFYISVGNLPVVANWIPYLTFLRWGFQALTINEYRGLTFTCNNDIGAAQNNDTTSCILTGEQELQILTFEKSSTGMAVLGLGEFDIFKPFRLVKYCQI